MKKIALIIVHFGQLNNYYEYWINSCRNNPTIDYLVFTDNNIFFNNDLIPNNMKTYHTTLDDFRNRISKLYDFPISLNEAYKICDYRVAYGEILEEELQGYDYWGYCDSDLIWGDIRHFLTDEILNNYEKIGFLGHLSIFHNTKENNSVYRKENSTGLNYYKKVFTNNKNCNFDEIGINDTYLYNDIKIYMDVNFVDLADLRHNFKMWFYQGNNKDNKEFIFKYENNKLFRLYIKNNEIIKEEIMYIHFHKRKKISINENNNKDSYLIIPNKIIPNTNISTKFIKEVSKPHWFKFYKELLSEQKTIYKKLKWLGYSCKYNYYLNFKNNKLNYWLWTNYNDKKKIDIFNYHK